jgi:hypothetical protein
VSRGQRGGSPTVVNLSFLDRSIRETVPKRVYRTVSGENSVGSGEILGMYGVRKLAVKYQIWGKL